MEPLTPEALAAIRDPRRLAAVRRLGLLDSAPEEAFDRLAALAARVLRAPAAMVVLVADDRQYVKSRVGLSAASPFGQTLPLEFAPGAATVVSAAPVAVADARTDPRPLARDRFLVESLRMAAFLGVPLVGAEAQPVGYLAVMDTAARDWSPEDITLAGELARPVATECALRESEQRYRQMVDLSPEPIAVHEGGTLVYLNDAAVKMVGGQSAAQFLGRSIMQFVHPDDRATVAARAQSTQEGRAASTLEETFLSLDGRAIDVEVVALPIAYEGRSATQVVIRDLTERKKAERTLRFLDDASNALAATLDYEQTLARVCELAVGALGEVCIIDVPDESGALHRVAVRTAEPAHAALAHTLAEHYPPAPGGAHPALRVLRDAQPVVVPELDDATLAQIARGPEHAAIVRALGLRSLLVVPLVAHGRALGVMTLGSTRPGRRYTRGDVPLAQELARRAALAIDNARAYKLAQEAVHVREDFLSVASHELRTPLTALQLNLERFVRAAARATPPAAAPQPVLAALRQTEQLAALIDNLLDVSRIVAGRMRLQLEPVDLAELAAAVVARLEPTAARAGCEIALAAPSPEVGAWDRQRLEQVLTNLLSNAIKYGAGRPIDVAVQGAGDAVRLTVRDRGIGIAPEDRERIFARFERAVSSRAYGGLGLGLFIARDIVAAHGGAITVGSTPDVGAVFEVVLPRAGTAGG